MSEDTTVVVRAAPLPNRRSADPAPGATLARALAALKLTLIHGDLSFRVTAALMKETDWPVGTVEYQRALLRIEHMIGMWHEENKSAIAQVDELIAENLRCACADATGEKP